MSLSALLVWTLLTSAPPTTTLPTATTPTTTAPTTATPPPPCADEARRVGLQAFRLLVDNDDRAVLDDAVRAIAPVKALRGKGKLDVLEMTGFVYKAEYRVRVLFAQVQELCAVMGFEVVEVSDPGAAAP